MKRDVLLKVILSIQTYFYEKEQLLNVFLGLTEGETVGAATFLLATLLRGLSRTHRNVETRQETIMMPRRRIRVTANPGVVMQIILLASSRTGTTKVEAVELEESSREKVRSPVDTTLMILLTPTSSEEVSRRCLLTRRSSLGRPCRYASRGSAGGGPYAASTGVCWTSINPL